MKGPHPKGMSGSITKGQRGALSELTAAAHLLDMGWHVFRALSPCCPCDLVVLRNGGKPLLIEVRTGNVSKIGTLYYAKNVHGRVNVDHYAIVVGSSVTFLPPLPMSEPPKE